MGYKVLDDNLTLANINSDKPKVCFLHGWGRSSKDFMNIENEFESGVDSITTYYEFAERVEKSKKDLIDLLSRLKRGKNKVVCYGATSKSTSIFNYCNIGPETIDYITDKTISNQGKLSPGMHIPVVSPQEGFNLSVDYAFLGAWNYLEEIKQKEFHFIKRGGKFITHVPKVSIV